MNWKIFLYRLMILTSLSVAGMLLYAVIINLFIKFGLMPENMDGYALINKTVYAFYGAILAAIAAFFIKHKMGRILLFSPLYAPSVFGIIYILIH